jgi:hypothetical protein
MESGVPTIVVPAACEKNLGPEDQALSNAKGSYIQKKPSLIVRENVIKAIQSSTGSPRDIAPFSVHVSQDGQKHSTIERVFKGTLTVLVDYL